jgi:DNA-binding beta-propeller fold protein YncE
LLYEVDQSGALLAIHDLSTLQLYHPRAIVFAPSSDQTDAAQTIHLFIADGGPKDTPTNQEDFPFALYLSLLRRDGDDSLLPASRIIEVTLDIEPNATAAAVPLVPLSLVQTLDLSVMDPPSPDPSGLDFFITEHNGENIPAFLIVDGEVEEAVNGTAPYWEGGNVFVIEVPDGPGVVPTLLYTGTTVNPVTRSINLSKGNGFSKEPVSVAFNPDNGHIFISSDDQRRVFEIDPGANNRIDHTDTIVAQFSTNLFPPLTHYPDDTDTDPEGMDYDPVTGRLYIADGLHSELYIVDPGANGIFDGVSSPGDDQLAYFDTLALGLQDPESVFVKSDGNLLFASNHTEDRLYEMARIEWAEGAPPPPPTSLTLAKLYDIGVANADNPAGIAIAPSSANPDAFPDEFSIYVADRMDDNNVAAGQVSPNDGRIYEFGLPQGSGSSDMIFVSSASGGKVSNIKFADEDVLVYSGGVWDIYFDGSDMQLPSAADVDAFSILPDGKLLLSFAADITIPNNGTPPANFPVKEFDVVLFDPDSLGTNTAGTFEMYFAGSPAGLNLAAEDIDAFALINDQGVTKYVLSIFGSSGSVPGITKFQDEDLVAYTPSTNSWALYFDGTRPIVGLGDASTEDIDGVWIDESNGDIYLTTLGAYTVSGLPPGDTDDIFICAPGALGANSSCTYRSYWDGGANGFAGEVIDSLFIIPEGQAASAMMPALRGAGHAGEGDDPNADLDEGPDDLEELEQEHQHRLFLPLADD